MPIHTLLDADKHAFVKTKVVATIGPASRDLDMLRRLIVAGVDMFRLNFSHGSYDEHLTALKNIRQASDELRQPVAIMQDLCGPKMRLTSLKGDKNIQLTKGSQISLAYGDKLSTEKTFYLTIVNPVKILKVGERVLLHDGMLELIVKDVNQDSVICEVTEDGEVRAHAGVAFPDSDFDLPATTEKDLADLNWAIENEVDYVAISFVQNADDVTRLRAISNKAGIDIRYIPKIERRVALKNITEILNVSDGILVARGDLGVEIPVEKLPETQNMLIKAANRRGLPVIVATEMLQSMITESRPTRAEITDISAAVDMGADAVMLSGETAIGKHPVACVDYMCSIAHEIEQHYDSKKHRTFVSQEADTSIPDALAFAAVTAAEQLNVDLLIAPTNSGATARLLAKYRPSQVITAVSNNKRSLQRMALYRGVRPLEGKEHVGSDNPDSYKRLFETLKNEEGFKTGDLAIVTGGLGGKSGSSNMHICKI